jgi:hypothetical protein
MNRISLIFINSKTFICAGLIYDWELFTENCLFLGGKKGLTTSDGQEEETRDHF